MEDEVVFSNEDWNKYLKVLWDFPEIRKRKYKAIFDGRKNITITKKEYEELNIKLEQHNKRWVQSK